MNNFDIIWTLEAENDLDGIYEFYLQVSNLLTHKIISEIVLEADKIIYHEEFQVDDINPNYPRIIIRHFKILYRIVESHIIIFAVFDSRQNPIKLKKLQL